MFSMAKKKKKEKKRRSKNEEDGKLQKRNETDSILKENTILYFIHFINIEYVRTSGWCKMQFKIWCIVFEEIIVWNVIAERCVEENGRFIRPTAGNVTYGVTAAT